MTISVVIPTRRRPEPLRETLESIKQSDPPPHEVVVVDGDEERSAEAVVREVLPDARYLASPPGLTRQRNLALREVTGNAVLFLDDDVTIDASLLQHVEAAYEDGGVVGVTGVVQEPDPRRFGAKQAGIRGLLFRGEEGTFTRFGYPRYLLDLGTPRDVEVMQGCFMSARTDAARAVGFDESLPSYGLAEDEDFSVRLSRLGRIRFVPEAKLVHRKTGFLTHDSRALGRSVVVNRAYLFRKNFPQTLLARVQFGVLVLVLVTHRLLNREWKGALGLLEGAVQAWRTRSA
jgi:GT2 family glycosyltransferase